MMILTKDEIIYYINVDMDKKVSDGVKKKNAKAMKKTLVKIVKNAEDEFEAIDDLEKIGYEVDKRLAKTLSLFRFNNFA